MLCRIEAHIITVLLRYFITNVIFLFFFGSLSDHELFTGQFGGLDSGFNSVDSGSKRWSGNEVGGCQESSRVHINIMLSPTPDP